MSGKPKVFIVTWCREAELLYGSLLIFKTLRTGFPTAEVTVIENASPPELRPPIYEAAAAAGCAVRQLEEERPHWSLVEEIATTHDQPTVVLDSDLAFWESVEDWTFGEALMAGRYLPEFADPFTDTLTMARLHSSHLWFPRPDALRARLAALARFRTQSGSLFQPRMMPPGWWRWDTASALFHALGEEAVRFGEPHLDAYDHLFCGSHLPLVLPRLGERWGGLMSELHLRSQTDLPSLKGVWRLQEQFFSSRPWRWRVEMGESAGG